MTRFFMTVPEAVHLVLQASARGTGGELFILNMGGPVKIVDLARDLIKLSGFTEDEIPIAFSGVRPGEKLHERLYDTGMSAQPTSHPEILQVVGPDPCIGSELDGLIHQLERSASEGNPAAISLLLSQIIPGFRPAADRQGPRYIIGQGH